MELLGWGVVFIAGYLCGQWRNRNFRQNTAEAISAEKERTKHVYTAAARNAGVDVESIEWLQSLREEERIFDGAG